MKNYVLAEQFVPKGEWAEMLYNKEIVSWAILVECFRRRINKDFNSSKRDEKPSTFTFAPSELYLPDWLKEERDEGRDNDPLYLLEYKDPLTGEQCRTDRSIFTPFLMGLEKHEQEYTLKEIEKLPWHPENYINEGIGSKSLLNFLDYKAEINNNSSRRERQIIYQVKVPLIATFFGGSYIPQNSKITVEACRRYYGCGGNRVSLLPCRL